MEVEVEATLDEQVAELEDVLKALKGKESALAKAQRGAWETQLKLLKEQQKLARPLPPTKLASTHPLWHPRLDRMCRFRR